MNKGEAAGHAIAKWAHQNPRLYAIIIWSILIGIFAGGIWMFIDRISDGKIVSSVLMVGVILIAALSAKKKPA